MINANSQSGTLRHSLVIYAVMFSYVAYCIFIATNKIGLNPNRAGLFLTSLGLGMPSPLIIFVVCGPIETKFCTGIDNQSISSNMEKKFA